MPHKDNSVVNVVTRVGRRTEIEQVREWFLRTFCSRKEAMLLTLASHYLGGFFLGICCSSATCKGEEKLFVVEMREGGKGSC